MILAALKNLVKEGGLYMAFIVTGSLLLISFWVSQNAQQNLLREYRYDTITLITATDPSEELRKLLNQKDVIRFEARGAFENKERLQAQYPELSSVITDLDSQYFPSSILVTVKNAETFQKSLKAMPDAFQKLIVHQAPKHLVTFFNLLLGLFAFLWLLLLALLIHFKIERLAVRESSRWSLMKMLGARPSQIFMPACWVQLLQIALGSVVVLVLAEMSMGYLRTLFGWQWEALSFWAFLGFFAGSILLGLGFFFVIFLGRYRRTSLG
jgi:cell division protein FtsX